MNTRTSARDPSALEREASEIRADLDRTLGALERKFSPGQLMDRSLDYLREHGADLTRNVSESVKRNPVPALMTAAGVVWLLSTFGSRRRESAEYARPMRASGRRHGQFHDRVAAARDRVRTARETVGETVTDKVSDTMDAARERTERMTDRMRTMVDEQPLVLGALAVAAGAVLGSLLPSTSYENRTLGQTRDRTLAKAKQAGERQYEKVRDKLSEPEEETPTTGRVN